VFIIFKNCETNKVALEILEDENSLIKGVKKLFCIPTKKTKDTQFIMGSKIEVDHIIEPDEILWENLSFSIEEQLVRKFTMQIIALLFILAATVIMFYLNGFDILVR